MVDKDTNRQDELDAIVNNPVMLTTTDNPYNPFTQWREWYGFDVTHGYNTCAYLARIVNSSHELSDADQALAIEYAINEIIQINLTGNYIKVTADSFKDRMKTIKNISFLK